MFRTLRPGQLAFDIIAPGLLLLVCIGPYLLFPNPLLSLFVLFGMCGALVIRRLAPGLSLTVAWCVSLIQISFGGEPDPSNLAILSVLYSVAAYGGRPSRWLGLASAFLGAGVITFYIGVLPYLLGQRLLVPGDDPVLSAWQVFLTAAIAFVLAWTLGLLVRTAQRARESRRAQYAAEQGVVVEQERTRIARDMHDVVAHSLAVVIAQADGARYLAKNDPEAVTGALETIAGTAREALSDVRVLLAQLRHSQTEGPQPVLDDLDRLYDQFRSTGLRVQVETTGEPRPVSTALQLAVYRIVQEALTNALRHGDIEHEAIVTFGWSDTELSLSIRSAVAPGVAESRLTESRGTEPRLGHGIAGMTERAVLVGGRLTAERVGALFVVRAALPISATAVAA